MLSTLLWLSLTVYHESRDQEFLDQVAIAHVILNRSSDSNSPVKEVVLKDKQFSCFNNGVELPTDPESMATATQAAATAMAGRDFTSGAKYYHSKRVKPHWRKKVSFVGTFGDHLFYKDMIKIRSKKVWKRGGVY